MQPSIVQAAEKQTTHTAALAYAALGMSVLPLEGKRPTLNNWSQYQQHRADEQKIRAWRFGNVGIVCGAVSGNLVVLDLDALAGYAAFAASFPELAETYTIASGGGVGRHVYFYAEHLPPSVKAMKTPIGNLELCANGRQVVAPPSVHPVTGNRYRVEKPIEIVRVPDLNALAAWIEAFKPAKAQPISEWKPPTTTIEMGEKTLNPRVIEAISAKLHAEGYRVRGEWLHGRCVYPERHKHGDKDPSFGFHTQKGFGVCHVCGVILAKDLCERLNIDPRQHGGLIEKPALPLTTARTERRTFVKDAPPDEPPPLNHTDEAKRPDWLDRYVAWAGTTGNQTPFIFHEAAGLWLLATAVGRRLYGEAPWGVRIYPNLYLMLVAGTTFYRKSTAYKLAEEVARGAIPHMLMSTPGSPERFQESLAGRMPTNFEKLTAAQKEQLRKAQPFAAQRGLLKDEVAGLFGAINRKDYMVGMKDLIMELYDCPDYFDKDTQSGLNIVERAALSILGATTPASLLGAVSTGDWENGLLVRFALLTPEPDYAERPAATAYQPIPADLIDDLRALHERLPGPQVIEMETAPPDALRLNVRCWDACREYGDWLRTLCDPRRDTELDDRLKGVYGRMHVQAFKLASLFAALDWLKTGEEVPTVTGEHWSAAQRIAERWRLSAHRLLEQLDKSGEAVLEKRQQDRMLNAIRQSGANGVALRDLYRNLNFSAKQARQLALDLVKAGLIEERRLDRAEWFIAVEHVDEAT